jgi:predicted porin
MRRSHRVSAQTNSVWVAGLSATSGSFVYTMSYGEDRQRHVAGGARKLGWLCADYLFTKRTDLYAVLNANRVTGAYPLSGFMRARGTPWGAELGLRHRF